MICEHTSVNGQSWLISGVIWAFLWRYWRKLLEISVRIAILNTDNWKFDHPNTTQDFWMLYGSIRGRLSKASPKIISKR
jgi:hypothetical protein